MTGWGSGVWRVNAATEEVAGVIDALGTPSGALVVLTGPAGIGKSALARAVADALAGDGRPTVRVIATLDEADRPFGALGGLVDTDGATEPVDVTDALRRLVAAAGSTQRDVPPLLLVDDLPLLDATSAAGIARLLRAGNLSVLATARAGTTLPAPIHGLDVDGLVTTLTVEPRTRSVLDASAHAFLGGPLAPETLDQLLDLSRGIPLHARELVMVNRGDGRFILGADGWAIDGGWIAPPTLFDLVTSRFLQLDDTLRRAVEALCLTQPLDLDQATDLVGTDVLVGLERHGIIEAIAEGAAITVRLAHPLYEESVRASLRPIAARAVVAHASEMLTPSAGDDPDLTLRLARLRLTHRLPIDGPTSRAGAQRALNLLDPMLAERLIEAGGDRSTESLLILGAALAAQGQTDRADVVLAEAWTAAIDDEQRGRALSRRAGNLGPGAGRFDEAIALVEDGLTHLTDPEWRGFIATDLSMLRSWSGVTTPSTGHPGSDDSVGGVGGGSSSSDRHADGATPPPTSPAVRANECLVGALIGALTGDTAGAAALADEGLNLVSHIERDVPHARDTLVLSQFLAKAFGGDGSGARAIADRELRRARTGTTGATGVWLAVRSLQHLVDGASADAIEEADEAIEELILGDAAGLRPLAQAVKAIASARQGHAEASRAAAASIEPRWRDEVKVQIHLTQAAGWQEVCEGRFDDAAALFAEAGRFGMGVAHVPMGAIAAYDAVRIGRPGAVLDILREATTRWSGPMSAAMASHAELAMPSRPRDRDPAALAATATALASAGLRIGAVHAWRQTAEAAALTGDDTLEVQARVAEARLRRQDIATRARAQDRVLTDREAEIARLVAAGRTSREVADSLGRSVRTVENHLASIYRKLGVSRRQDLAQLLVEVGLSG